MNTTDWIDLAQVYDEKFKVLEEARLAYGQAIAAILHSIAGDLAERAILDQDIRTDARNPSYPDTGDHPAAPMRKTLEYSVTNSGGFVHARVLARFSSPWDGAPGYLQFAVVSRIDSKWIWRLRELAVADEWVKQQSGKVEILEFDWIYAHAINLSDQQEFLTSASETVGQLLRLAHKILLGFRAECIEYRMDDLLATCNHRLESDPEMKRSFPDRGVTRGTDFGSQWYLQINPAPGQVGFWVAYEFDRGSLMFGNNPTPEDILSKLQVALQEKIGAGSWEIYEGHPGGTIMDAKRLGSATDEEILEVMTNAFRTFVRVVAEPGLAHQEMG